VSRIPVERRPRHERVSLGQREGDRADSHKQEQIRRTSNKMRFDSRINLFFHVESLVKRSLSLLWLWTHYPLQKIVAKCQHNVLQIYGFVPGDPPHAATSADNSHE
jgi:hypothetical protein